jgi:3-oxoacyl-[acyl-carrier protein] reductase
LPRDGPSAVPDPRGLIPNSRAGESGDASPGRSPGVSIATVLGQNAPMDLELRDRVYLVTGGSRGLGFAAAQALIGEGAQVVVASPHEATASAAAERLGQSSRAANTPAWIVADNADPDAASRLIAAAKRRYGRLDGALISVGGTPTGSVASTTDDAWRAAFESVFLGAVRLARVIASELMGIDHLARRTGEAGSEPLAGEH